MSGSDHSSATFAELLAVQSELTRVMKHPDAESTVAVLSVLGAAFGCRAAVAWSVGPAAGSLTLLNGWCSPELQSERFLEEASAWAFPGPVGAPAAALITRRPSLGRANQARPGWARFGFGASFAFPIIGPAGVQGVIELFCDEPRRSSDDFLDILESIGRHIGQWRHRFAVEDELKAQVATRTAALRESESRLLQMTENIDIAFTLRQLDPSRYLYVSPAFRQLTGYSRQELISRPLLGFELVFDEDRARVEEGYRTCAESGIVVAIEHRIVCADGGLLWVRIVITPILNESGRVERVVTSTEDITERIVTAQALEKAEISARVANAAKTEFLSRMSHELRTPLNAVLGFSQLLERSLEGTDHLESVRHIRRAGRHLLDLINEVLDVSRIESGQISISLEPVRVSSIVSETTTLMQPLADEAGVSLLVTPGATDTHVHADRQRLRQVLLNLISNAIKYNRAAGSVWLSWNRSGALTTITVRDDGPGIAPELHERLFVAFDRLGAANSGIEGTGVGLAVTRALAELMHGSVFVDSRSGAGASFSVVLPSSPGRAPIDGEPAAGEGAAATAPDLGGGPDLGKRAIVLYVEDNEPNVQLVSSVVRLRPGWHLIHAGSCSLGLELARAHRPDLVLLDLHLPDGSGVDLLRALRRDEDLRDAPVVVLSADASRNQSRLLTDAGATGYLTKPIDVDELVALLDRVYAGGSEPVG